MALQDPLHSLGKYSEFVVTTVDRPTVQRSTLAVWSTSPYTGIAEGEVLFPEGLKLRVLEELDFDAGLITGYSYEVYRHDEKLYWYLEPSLSPIPQGWPSTWIPPAPSSIADR